jgi:hypothetical protein
MTVRLCFTWTGEKMRQVGPLELLTPGTKRLDNFLCDFKWGHITEKSLNNRVRLDGPQVDK